MLDHDDGVGSVRDRRAGHDLDGFVLANAARVCLTGTNFADDCGVARETACVYCKAVAEGASDRRVWAIGLGFARQHATGRGEQGDVFDRGYGSMLADLVDDALTGFAESQGRHEIHFSG